jgi:hypothetical protein
MLRRINDKWLEGLTKHYLDIAEKLPPWGRFIKGLQYTRSHQREGAQKLYTETRAPVDVSATFSGFRLMELFPAEEYDRLFSGLRNLFPAEKYGRDQIDRLGTNFPGLFEGGWSNLGILHRDESKWPALSSRTLPELPEEVTFIEVSAHKILPSAIVVAFDVQITEAATKQLTELHNRKYLPISAFHKWMPWWKSSGWSRSETPAEYAMEDAILEWEDGLRSGVERIIRAYLPGFFSKSSDGPNRLLAIDNFTVAGLPLASEPPDKRLQGKWRWLESFVLQLHGSRFGTFIGEELMFAWTEHREERRSVPYKLVELYSELSTDENAQSHRRSILRESLDAVLPYVCFLEAISRVRIQLETLRIRVYQTLTRSGSVWKGIKGEMQLNDRLQKETMFVSRLALELEDAKPWLEGEISVVRELVQSSVRQSDKPHNLADSLITSLNFHLDRVRKHLDLVAKTFGEYISRRNIAVMYRLQFRVLLLTIAATLAAILGALANWYQIEAAFRAIFGHSLP